MIAVTCRMTCSNLNLISRKKLALLKSDMERNEERLIKIGYIAAICHMCNVN